MTTLTVHLRAMAYNNAWSNHRLHAACRRLSDEDFSAARSGFFPSIRATLNHVLTVDWYYLDAIERSLRGDPPHPDAGAFFDPQEPFGRCAELAAAQAASDRRLIAACRSLDPSVLHRMVAVPRSDEVRPERLDRLLAHLFQHQIHHRGQAHAMLSGTPVAPPQLDEFYCASDRPLRDAEMRALGFDEDEIWADASGPDIRNASGAAPVARGRDPTEPEAGHGSHASADRDAFRVRAFAPADETAVVALWQRCGLTRPWNDPRRDIARKREVDPELFLVGEANGAIVATIMAGYEGHRGWLNYLAVTPEHRARGVGRRLVGEAERLLRARRCPKINLQVRDDNPDAIGFYTRLGYERDAALCLGKRLEHDGPPPGRGDDGSA